MLDSGDTCRPAGEAVETVVVEIAGAVVVEAAAIAAEQTHRQTRPDKLRTTEAARLGALSKVHPA